MPPLNHIQFHHEEHREWMNQLQFYQEQIHVFKKELNIVLTNYTGSYSIIEHVDEYRNIFQKKLDLIKNFQHQIQQHEKHIAHAVENWEEELWDHQELRGAIENFENDFQQLKTNFKGFVARHFHKTNS